jgi:hypothetical protein
MLPPPATASWRPCGVLKECWRLGLMPLERQVRACDSLVIRGSRLPKGRRLTEHELARLFQACAADRRATERRDAAMLALLYGAGLRRTKVRGEPGFPWTVCGRASRLQEARPRPSS